MKIHDGRAPMPEPSSGAHGVQQIVVHPPLEAPHLVARPVEYAGKRPARFWGREIPDEGAMRRTWRLHPIKLVRMRAFVTDSWWLGLRMATREWLGLAPRFHRGRAVIWGHRRHDVSACVPPPRVICNVSVDTAQVEAAIERTRRALSSIAHPPRTYRY